MNSKTPEYKPGSCNIGDVEVRRRKISGVIGGLFSIAFYVATLSFHASKGVRALVFFPLVAAATGWLQTRSKFCLAFGMTGVFNFGGSGEVSRVVDPEERSEDRTRALIMLSQAIAISAVFALFFTLVPA